MGSRLATEAGSSVISALEARIKALESELDHARRLAILGTLAGGVAHELNNLVTPMLAYIEMAKRHPADADLARHALERASHGAEQASKIAGAILDFSADFAIRDPGTVADVRTAIENAMLLLIRNPARDSIEVRVSAPAGITASIDAICLQHILLNLFLNARNAMRPHGGRLEIRVGDGRARSPWNLPPQQSEVVIEVEDTGRGISPALLPDIFDPFVTSSNPEAADGRTSGARPGSGLGLAVVKQLVERAGGSVAVRSVVGEGSCFTVRLPRPQMGAVPKAA